MPQDLTEQERLHGPERFFGQYDLLAQVHRIARGLGHNEYAAARRVADLANRSDLSLLEASLAELAAIADEGPVSDD